MRRDSTYISAIALQEKSPAGEPHYSADDAQPRQKVSNNKSIKTSRSSSGFFFATCTPWANIVIDGDTVDITPLAAPLELSPGRHQVEFVNPNYKSHNANIETLAGITDTLNIILEPAYGYLMVRVSPWAQVFIDGEYKEDTPLTKPFILTSGLHILKVINPTFGTLSDSIYVELDKMLEKHYTLGNSN